MKKTLSKNLKRALIILRLAICIIKKIKQLVKEVF